MADFNSTFVLSIGTLCVTATAGCMAYALRSKCTSVKLCCGLIDITRDVNAELEEDRIVSHIATEPGAAVSLPPLPPPPPPRISAPRSNRS